MPETMLCKKLPQNLAAENSQLLMEAKGQEARAGTEG